MVNIVGAFKIRHVGAICNVGKFGWKGGFVYLQAELRSFLTLLGLVLALA